MGKIINFEDTANKARKNKQSGAEKADFPDFAEWYAEYILDHKSDFIRLVMPYVRDTAESACQLAALNFKNFYLIPESLLCFLNLVEEGASTSIPFLNMRILLKRRIKKQEMSGVQKPSKRVLIILVKMNRRFIWITHRISVYTILC